MLRNFANGCLWVFEFLKILLGVEVVLLFIQLWLGMSINLFVKLPLNAAQDFSSYFGGTEVLAHLVNGILVLALAGLILSYSFRLSQARISVLSALGLVFVIKPLQLALHCFSASRRWLFIEDAMSFIIVYTVYLSLFYFVEKIQERT